MERKTHRDLRHTLVDDVHGIEANEAVDRSELEQGELNEFCAGDQRAGLHNE